MPKRRTKKRREEEEEEEEEKMIIVGSGFRRWSVGRSVEWLFFSRVAAAATTLVMFLQPIQLRERGRESNIKTLIASYSCSWQSQAAVKR